MKLENWLKTNNVSITAFAKRVKLSRQIVYGYSHGKLPTIPTALRIEEETEGQVNLYSWAEGVDTMPRRGKNKKAQDTKKTVDKISDLW